MHVLVVVVAQRAVGPAAPSEEPRLLRSGLRYGRRDRLACGHHADLVKVVDLDAWGHPLAVVALAELAVEVGARRVDLPVECQDEHVALTWGCGEGELALG